MIGRVPGVADLVLPLLLGGSPIRALGGSKMRMFMRFTPMVATFALAACTGSVPSQQGDDDASDNGDDLVGAPPEVQNDLNEALPPVNCEDRSAKVGVSPSRRLTVEEYDRTLRDLFRGIDVGKPSRDYDFPTDVTHNLVFTNNARSQVILPRLAAGYMNVAQDLSTKATTKLNDFLGCDPASGEDACAGAFLDRFGERAFRRPLTSEERQELMQFYQEQKPELQFRGAVQALVERMLVSPRFLYRFETFTGGPNKDEASTIDDWALASRISYLTTGSMPDEELFKAARSGGLRDAEEIRAHVERLLETPDAKAVIKQFFSELYQTFRIPGSSKAVYPTYTPGVVNAMKDEVDQFLVEQFFADGDAWPTMVGGSHSYMNDELAMHYGLQSPGSKDPVHVELDPNRSAGFLTMGGIMSMLAGPHDNHPEVVIYRGKWMNERLLCFEGLDVPLGVPPLEFMSEGLTNREILEKHVSEPACAACHKFIDPFGYPFENYDAVGRWRDADDKGRPIDARGDVTGIGAADGPVEGAAELGDKLAGSVFARACFARRLFENVSGREMDVQLDVCTARKMAGVIIKTGSIKEALFAYILSDAFTLARTE